MSDPVVRVATSADLAVLEGFEQRVVGAERACDPTLQNGALRHDDPAARVARPHLRRMRLGLTPSRRNAR